MRTLKKKKYIELINFELKINKITQIDFISMPLFFLIY